MSFPVGLTLGAVFIGKAVSRWEGRPASAIGKEHAGGEHWLTKTGLRGDEQADLSVHGGPEKALHHYAAEHYDFWKREMPELSDKFAPGASARMSLPWASRKTTSASVTSSASAKRSFR